eukprot:4571674-Pyramimonas_sp.AAC.1
MPGSDRGYDAPQVKRRRRRRKTRKKRCALSIAYSCCAKRRAYLHEPILGCSTSLSHDNDAVLPTAHTGPNPDGRVPNEGSTSEVVNRHK